MAILVNQIVTAIYTDDERKIQGLGAVEIKNYYEHERLVRELLEIENFTLSKYPDGLGGEYLIALHCERRPVTVGEIRNRLRDCGLEIATLHKPIKLEGNSKHIAIDVSDLMKSELKILKNTFTLSGSEVLQHEYETGKVVLDIIPHKISRLHKGQAIALINATGIYESVKIGTFDKLRSSIAYYLGRLKDTVKFEIARTEPVHIADRSSESLLLEIANTAETKRKATATASEPQVSAATAKDDNVIAIGINMPAKQSMAAWSQSLVKDQNL